MIITKTPYRISFFGGGTDFEEYFSKHEGEVIGSTIDKYCYVSLRTLQKFFKHKHRISWSRIENINNISEIYHPTVRGILKHYNIKKKGLEIHYDGDLPGNSGVGSSSSFCVGLLNALNQKYKVKSSKKNLAKSAYFIESKIVKENVGMQDQVWASYGGFNSIKFKKNDFSVTNLKLNENVKNLLQNNLMMFFSGKSRFSNKIEKDKKKKLKKKIKFYHEIKSQITDCKKILKSTKNLNDFGILLNEYWKIKKSLSLKVSSCYLDDMYNEAISCGALGGKILGSGGGGFIIFYIEKKNQYKLKKRLYKLQQVKFKFSDEGSSVIYCNE